LKRSSDALFVWLMTAHPNAAGVVQLKLPSPSKKPAAHASSSRLGSNGIQQTLVRPTDIADG
jgi:hypothetical protein